MTAPARSAVPDGPFAVVTKAVVKRFGSQTVLGGVDLQVPTGAVYVLVGANGAGKSTLLRVLMNLVAPDAGKIRMLGLDPRHSGPQLRAQVGYVPEGSDCGYGWMRVGRLLQHHARLYPNWDEDYVGRLARVFDVQRGRRLRDLSKGEARRVHIVLALAHRPRLLLLDEPTDGLDPVVTAEVLSMLSEYIADTGCTIVMSTHRAHDVDRLTDHVGVLRGGELLAQFSREQMHRLLRVYRADVPSDWTGAPGLNGAVLRRSGLGRRIDWTVWGQQHDVTAHLYRAGAVVREVSPLTLDDAVMTLLGTRAPR